MTSNYLEKDQEHILINKKPNSIFNKINSPITIPHKSSKNNNFNLNQPILNKNYSTNSYWVHKKFDKIEKLNLIRKLKEEREFGEIQEKPVINENSNRLTRSFSDFIFTKNVFERLSLRSHVLFHKNKQLTDNKSCSKINLKYPYDYNEICHKYAFDYINQRKNKKSSQIFQNRCISSRIDFYHSKNEEINLKNNEINSNKVLINSENNNHKKPLDSYFYAYNLNYFYNRIIKNSEYRKKNVCHIDQNKINTNRERNLKILKVINNNLIEKEDIEIPIINNKFDNVSNFQNNKTKKDYSLNNINQIKKNHNNPTSSEINSYYSNKNIYDSNESGKKMMQERNLYKSNKNKDTIIKKNKCNEKKAKKGITNNVKNQSSNFNSSNPNSSNSNNNNLEYLYKIRRKLHQYLTFQNSDK